MSSAERQDQSTPKLQSGVTGSALKRDGAGKHAKSDTNVKAVNLMNKPKSLDELYRTTPIGKCMAAASSEEKSRFAKLMDVAYVVAKEELPFAKYPTFSEVEKRHGVLLGNTYTTEHKCSEFAHIIGETMRDEVLESLSKAKYFSVLVDGSKDSGVVEKELTYIRYVDQSKGEVQCRFLRLKDIASGTAATLISGMEKTFIKLGIKDFQQRLVAFCADEASVNMGCVVAW